MNTCKAIDYKISIYPTIVPHPSEIVLTARILLPDNKAIQVQLVADKCKLDYKIDAAERLAEVFTPKIAKEISALIKNDAKQDIDKQK